MHHSPWRFQQSGKKITNTFLEERYGNNRKITDLWPHDNNHSIVLAVISRWIEYRNYV